MSGVVKKTTTKINVLLRRALLSRQSTVVTAPDQQRVQLFQSSQRCFKREAASAASGEGLLLYLNTCLRWLCWVIEGQSERGHSEPCLWQKGTVMEKTGKGNLTQSDGQECKKEEEKKKNSLKSLFTGGVVIGEIDSALSTIITRVLLSNIQLHLVSWFIYPEWVSPPPNPQVSACPLLMLIQNVLEH